MVDPCPSCRRKVDGEPADCPHCGIIFAKWRPRPEASGMAAAEVSASKDSVSGGIVAAVLIGVLAVVGLFAKQNIRLPEAPKPPKTLRFAWPPVKGQTYPDLKLLDQDGHEVALSSFKGKLILLEPVGMTCAACNAYSGANRPEIGHFEGAAPQENLTSAEEFFPQYTGIQLDDDRLVWVQLILYNLKMQSPTPEDAKRWATHFHRSGAKNHFVLVPKDDMTGSGSYGMIPGFQLIDKNFVLRYDATGDNPKEDLWSVVLPAVPGLL